MSYITGLAGTAGGGYWVDNLGRPRLAMFDNPWALIPNGGEWTSGDYQTEMGNYLSSRAAQGFTGLYVTAIGCGDVGTTQSGVTWDGVAPFTGNNPSNGLNSTYWTRVDYLITTAESHGLTVWLNIAYTSSVAEGNLDSGGALHGLTQAQYTAYGTALAGRYGSQPNIVWMYGNDYFSGAYDTQFGYIRSAIIAAGDTHAMAVHVYPESTSRYDIETGTDGSNGTTFGYGNSQADWVYTYNVTYFGIERAFEEPSAHGIGALPPVWGDGYFYDSGAALPTDQMMRQMAWWALSSGARGMNNGSNDIWPWGSGSPAAVTAGLWYTQSAGATRTVIESLPGWYLLTPDTSSTLVTAGRGTHATGISTGDNYNGGTDDYVTASYVASTGKGIPLAVIYCAKAFSITVNASLMVPGYTATWVDPANGTTYAGTPGATYNSGTARGNNSQGEPDWALVLQGTPAAASQPPYLYSMQRCR